MSLPDRMMRRIRRRELIVGAAAAGAAACVGCSLTDPESVAETPAATDAIDAPETGDIGDTGDTADTGDTGQPMGLDFVIELGSVSDVLQAIDDHAGFWYVPEGRMWVVRYPAQALEAARSVYSELELVPMEAGFVVLYQKCPHLGCRVPSCESSQWFECPCHGSKYNQVGEQQRGPAPRGMDRFATVVTDDDQVLVDTASLITGPPLGVDTTRQATAGPFCVAEASH